MATMTAAERKYTKTKIPGLWRVPPSRIFPNGGYKVRYRDSNNRSQQKTFATKKAALDYRAAFRTDKNRGDIIDPMLAATPFREVAWEWFDTNHDWKPKTRVGNESILKYSILGDRKEGKPPHPMPEFAEMAVGSIKVSHVNQLLGALQKEGASPSTRRNILHILGPVFEYALADEMVKTNPTASIRIKNGTTPPREMSILTEKEVAMLAKEVGPDYSTLVLFAAYSGLRAGEIGALRVRDVDLLHRCVTVRASLSDVNGKQEEGTPKNGKVRKVAIPRQVVDLLTEHLAGKKLDDLAFPGPSGGYLRHGNFYGRVYRPAVVRLVERGELPEVEKKGKGTLPQDKADLRFHDLRHTCASLLIAAGVHPKAIQEQLGHSSIVVTMDRYGKLYESTHDTVADALEGRFAEGGKPAPKAKVRQIR
jgi:integrase